MPLRLATRGSALALVQARGVAELLGEAELVEASSDGKPGDKARFVRGVEEALIEGRAEIGVHSAKDLPADMPQGLLIAGVPPREDPADAWVGEGGSLGDVPEGARVGTFSLRRASQLLAARPDLRIAELHGNVDTRLRKLADGAVDALVLAVAGLRRLGREGEIGFTLPTEVMTPAAGQGALALQARRDDEPARGAAARISDDEAVSTLTAERTVVAELGADCTSPLGVSARIENGEMTIEAYVGLPDGSEWLRDRFAGEGDAPAILGAAMAQRLTAAGAADILERAAEMAA